MIIKKHARCNMTRELDKLPSFQHASSETQPGILFLFYIEQLLDRKYVQMSRFFKILKILLICFRILYYTTINLLLWQVML